MHACGHDAHVAILLGVAKFFSLIPDQVKGNIKWIFQPAEEGGGGGRVMVEEGVLENPKVDAIFGAHVFPFLPMGKVGINEREGLAAADRFTIKIIGQGGHAASPHVAKDPILAAGHLITQIHSIVSRDINPLDSGVVTIGKVSGGTAFNIIPDEVELLGTVRSLNPQVREELKSQDRKSDPGDCSFLFSRLSGSTSNMGIPFWSMTRRCQAGGLCLFERDREREGRNSKALDGSRGFCLLS